MIQLPDGTSLPPLADGEYDAIVLGTGLKECIISGARASSFLPPSFLLPSSGLILLQASCLWTVRRFCTWIGTTTMEESRRQSILTSCSSALELSRMYVLIVLNVP